MVASGMSGSPILDTKTNRVVGIISERYRTHDDVDRDLSFGIAVDSMLQVYPDLKRKTPGLKKFNNFLQAIEKRGFLIYDKFEDVYVPPIEYDQIQETLKRNRCILIIGTAEYDKTYTAINLLWEYCKSNHMPKYIEEGSIQAAEIIKKLKQIDESLKNAIIYLEDPVGKTEYRSNKELEESIGSIISALGNLDPI
jgi:hypothetical protein